MKNSCQDVWELLKYQATHHGLPEGHLSSRTTVIAGQEVDSVQAEESHTHNTSLLKLGRFCPWTKEMQHISDYLSLSSVQENG